MSFVIKRIYEPAAAADGQRVLVDRLWPRGVSKDRARLDLWLKDAAPSPDLRKEFGHMKERFAAFREQYLAELKTDSVKQLAVGELLAMEKKGAVTLLYGARDPVVNHANVLLEHLLAVKKSQQ